MYTQGSEDTASRQDFTEQHGDGLLDDQLRRDESGDLRDQLTDELAMAVQDIETALAGELAGSEAEILRDLLQALKISESILLQVWDSMHA